MNDLKSLEFSCEGGVLMPKSPTSRKVGEMLNIEIKKGTEEIPKTIYAELARCFFSEITEFYNNQRKD